MQLFTIRWKLFKEQGIKEEGKISQRWLMLRRRKEDQEFAVDKEEDKEEKDEE